MIKKSPQPELQESQLETPVVLLEDDDADIASALERADLEAAKEEAASKKSGLERFYPAIGRRKESTARVRLYTRKSSDALENEDQALITVNGKPYTEYFRLPRLQAVVEFPLRKLKSLNRFKATARVSGGGMSGQADALRFGLSRALVLFDPNFAKKLRRAGSLTRDARVKERRKYGLKKARKSPQWSKR